MFVISVQFLELTRKDTNNQYVIQYFGNYFSTIYLFFYSSIHKNNRRLTGEKNHFSQQKRTGVKVSQDESRHFVIQDFSGGGEFATVKLLSYL